MANRAGKGSKYEREICVMLSKWWTDGKREDVFWRSSGSGARAKTRGRKGRKTAGQHGDVCAIDPVGEPLIDLLTIEIKRGYNKHTIQDLIDRSASAALQWWETTVEQAVESHELSGSFAWLLIVRRDQRTAMVVMPWVLWRTLVEVGVVILDDVPQFELRVEIRDGMKVPDWHTLKGMPLKDFLRVVRPEHLKKLAKVA